MADNGWSEWDQEQDDETSNGHQSLHYTIFIVGMFFGLTCIGWRRYLRERSRLMAMYDNDHTNSEQQDVEAPVPREQPKENKSSSSERQRFVRKHLESKEWCVRANFTISGTGSTDDAQDLEAVSERKCIEPECPICLTPFSKKERVSSSTNPLCPHIFHYKCVYKWLLSKKECPMCRNAFLKQDISGTDADISDDTKPLSSSTIEESDRSHRTLLVFFGRAEDDQDTHPSESTLEEDRA